MKFFTPLVVLVFASLVLAQESSVSGEADTVVATTTTVESATPSVTDPSATPSAGETLSTSGTSADPSASTNPANPTTPASAGSFIQPGTIISAVVMMAGLALQH